MNLDSLNTFQRQSVEKFGGPILVFAGAGSGKTRVLTYKIAYLINELGLPPDNILAVTFTNKAAQEMKVRVSELVECNISGIHIGTFHSISARILRKEIALLGYTNDFVIYDQQDSRTLVKNIIKELNLDSKQFDHKSIQIRISNAKNSLQSVSYIESTIENFSDEKFHQIYKEYQRQLKSNNCLDFDDLLLLPLELFKQFPERLKFYQEKFKYVLVDEYQDTNKPQFEFIYSLSSGHKDIFVVGDDDQSIYGWRGADISNILNFQEAFGESTIIKLEQNYRSTQNILSAAWSVVSKNVNRAEKKLWTENDSGDLIGLLESFDERDESRNILKDIKTHKDELNEIAILYRTNSQSRVIEDELRRSGIPYQIIGGVKFYDRKEIKDLICYIRLIVNHNDSIGFDRIINFPARGVGKTSLSKIHDYSNSNQISYMDAIKQSDEIAVGQKQQKILKDFYEFIQLYKTRSITESGSDIIKDLLKDIGLKNYYLNQRTDDALSRWENIEEFVSSIKEFESNNEEANLSAFLEEVSLLTDIDRWNDSQDAVTLMTVHSAKGLEFNHVFIAGLEDGLFPIVRYLEDSDIEEERRLFYVALTRAKKRAILSYAKSRRKFGSEPIMSIKSRFIDEINEDLLDKSLDKGYKFEDAKTSIGKSNSFNKFKNDNQAEIRVGHIVEHKVFGKGKVLNIEGVDQNSKLTIKFFNNVTKKLILKYANLKIIS